MTEDYIKLPVARPVRQSVVINLTTKQSYPPVIWRLIAERVIGLIIESEYITASDNTKMEADLEMVGRKLWSFKIRFEIMNTSPLLELHETTNAVYQFLLQIGAKEFGSEFARVDKD